MDPRRWKTYLDEEDGPVFGVGEHAHQGKGGVRREYEVSAPVGRLQKPHMGLSFILTNHEKAWRWKGRGLSYDYPLLSPLLCVLYKGQAHPHTKK